MLAVQYPEGKMLLRQTNRWHISNSRLHQSRTGCAGVGKSSTEGAKMKRLEMDINMCAECPYFSYDYCVNGCEQGRLIKDPTAIPVFCPLPDAEDKGGGEDD